MRKKAEAEKAKNDDLKNSWLSAMDEKQRSKVEFSDLTNNLITWF